MRKSFVVANVAVSMLALALVAVAQRQSKFRMTMKPDVSH